MLRKPFYSGRAGTQTSPWRLFPGSAQMLLFLFCFQWFANCYFVCLGLALHRASSCIIHQHRLVGSPLPLRLPLCTAIPSSVSHHAYSRSFGCPEFWALPPQCNRTVLLCTDCSQEISLLCHHGAHLINFLSDVTVWGCLLSGSWKQWRRSFAQ